MNTNNFLVYIKTIYLRRHYKKFWEQNLILDLERPLPRGKKKVIGLMKGELSGETMAEFATFRPKTYSYLTDVNDENKKAKAQKSV